MIEMTTFYSCPSLMTKRTYKHSPMKSSTTTVKVTLIKNGVKKVALQLVLRSSSCFLDYYQVDNDFNEPDFDQIETKNDDF